MKAANTEASEAHEAMIETATQEHRAVAISFFAG